MIAKTNIQKSTGAEMTAGHWAVDPGGNLVLLQATSLKDGWRWATDGDIKSKEAAEAARAKAEKAPPTKVA